MPYIIGVCGPSCGGKTTTCLKIRQRFENTVGQVVVFSQDWYYAGLSANQQASDVNFDLPDALKWDEMYSDLRLLKSGQDIEAPIYDFSKHQPLEKKQHIKAAKIILVEGILILTTKKFELCVI